MPLNHAAGTEPVAIDAAVLAEAEAEAAKAIAAAGCDLRELETIDELTELSDLLDEIWGAPEPLMNTNLLRALSKAGSYVAAAYVDGEMVGGCVGFHEQPEKRALHSHIAGVRPELIGRKLGVALKLHQRVWALQRGVTAIEWTYDPLVARNAYFNIEKLGARPVEYLANFYGSMNDTINGVDESDRVLIRWDLVDPPAAAVAGVDTVAVGVPEDIEALRLTDPDAAREWRLRVREGLQPLLASGGAVVGFDRERGYLIQNTRTTQNAQNTQTPGDTQ
ncbi:GNAT family N-acetyltransferase [Nocardioides sp. Kera G14]|uniref:GNAT family N-acetyltransferase n=1 Tax=Nocardioides sp. Kera G14 TaxID=2884264 RepID=UPI001D1284B9|nr:GNAT family N-acetyltransferase [Nocardioides sp. Kera G14]UDY23826.1 GNAT family N-acetyltransferase [Nocardioides sp. Kera G14]